MKRQRRPLSPDSALREQVPHSGLLLLLVFSSGFAALVYELLWFRQLGLVFGNTVQAAATVLAAFMIGLAGGAHWVRGSIDRIVHPIRWFGFVEAGIGLYALLVPLAFALIQIVYKAAAKTTLDSTPMLTALRFVLALLVLLVPTMLMGASLPIVSEATLRSRNQFATKLGLLYGCNTAGATAGVLACGFLLVPTVGVQISNCLAAAINLAVAGAALLIARNSAGTRPQSTPAQDNRTVNKSPVFLLVIAALCGGLALAFETVWFRALVLVFGATCYSFAIMVACFLLGIAVGSAALARLSNVASRASWVLAGALVGTGLWTFFSSRMYSGAPEQLLSLLMRFNYTWMGMVVAEALVAAFFLLPIAMFSGLAFTAVVRLIRDRTSSAGSAVGAAFSVNALGSAAGSAAAGFLILPRLGLEHSLLLLGGASLLIGLAVAWWCTGVAPKIRIAFIAVIVLCAAATRFGAGSWDPLLLSSGAYFAARANTEGGKVRLKERLSSVELLFYREGTTATVDVKRTAEGRLYYSSDGKVEADASPQSMVLQRLMGHLPMLFHPEPRRVLNIGLGAGVTCGALTCYPCAQVDVVEIEPAAKEVAAIWAPRNHDLIKRGKFRFIANDGRNHLLVTPDRYDVITSDPFEPVVAGAASLYTVDHFQLARSRLAPNGVMAQFLPLYELSREDLMMILRSFMRVFPRSCVFFTGTDTVLVGMTGDTDLRLANAAPKFSYPAVRDSLAEIGVDRPERLLEMLVMDIHPDRNLVPDGPVNTDDLPRIEFSAPRSALEYRTDTNQKVLLDSFQPIPSAYLEGLDAAVVEEVKRGHAGLRLLLEASVLRSAGSQKLGVELLTRAAEQAPRNPIIQNELAESLLLAAKAEPTNAGAARLYKKAIQADPTNFWALYNLVLRADETSKSSEGDDYLGRALQAYPDAPLLLALRGRRQALAGDFTGACRDLESAIQKLPQRADFWQAYAILLDKTGRTDEAQKAFTRAKALNLR